MDGLVQTAKSFNFFSFVLDFLVYFIKMFHL